MVNRSTLFQFMRFCCVGAANAAVDFCIYYILAWYIPIYIGRVISWAAACLFSYIVNKHWTFKAKDTGLAPLIRFVVVNLASLAIGLLLLYVYTQLGANSTIAFWLMLPFTTLVNYFGYKLWGFKDHS